MYERKCGESAYRGCDGMMYVYCPVRGEDIPSDMCAVHLEHPEDECQLYRVSNDQTEVK